MARRYYTVFQLAATLAFLLLSPRNASAFLMPLASTATISSKTSLHHQNVNRGNKIPSSITDDDPWVLLEEFKLWATNGKYYDLIQFENAINTLRHECRSNIYTLEKEIASIQQTLQQGVYQSQCTSIDWPSQQHVNDFDGNDRTHCAEDTPLHSTTLKAVVAGLRVTEEDRKRLQSAHPEEFL
eukprot:CAMPEP_0172563448 /NCGR_PEP_ID=MMETSP1067-20121228/100697_1 /TAXON_ID=265564 ORGANISM="Thalassiosira punctigera, Strain Tpunct2005C2" /NCGR_SAMPLE_ID=MMETSP1067 /ASSEMBLY_ACC=CAM_ASM_000444 /LENGTH=183 /DNA_ID=CAMNT_0013353899 /DNA_START=114 /DNA_END=665 /DNA_ORIENTATION=-